MVLELEYIYMYVNRGQAFRTTRTACATIHDSQCPSGFQFVACVQGVGGMHVFYHGIYE